MTLGQPPNQVTIPIPPKKYWAVIMAFVSATGGFLGVLWPVLVNTTQSRDMLRAMANIPQRVAVIETNVTELDRRATALEEAARLREVRYTSVMQQIQSLSDQMSNLAQGIATHTTKMDELQSKLDRIYGLLTGEHGLDLGNEQNPEWPHQSRNR